MKSAFLAPLIVLSAASGSLAGDPWSKPCFDGECALETLKISGPKEMISDISTVTDWIVLDCTHQTGPQTVRIVCKYPEDSSNCKNLDEYGGPINKIIRIPQDCTLSGNFFFRVAKSWVSADQSIPAEVRSTLPRSDTPSVRSLALDYNFSQIPKDRGAVSFMRMPPGSTP